MKIRFFLTSFYAFLFSCCFGQDTSQLVRKPYKLTVAVDTKTVYEEELTAKPFILPDKTVQLYPGETVYIEVDQQNGTISSLKAVKDISDPTKTLTVSFTQTAKKKVHELVTLKIVNPFKQNLVYDATIFLMRQNKWVKTDVYPVQAELTAYETWTDIITSIGLGHWRFENK